MMADESKMTTIFELLVNIQEWTKNHHQLTVEFENSLDKNFFSINVTVDCIIDVFTTFIGWEYSEPNDSDDPEETMTTINLPEDIIEKYEEMQLKVESFIKFSDK